jgi:hypothetical protein
MIQGYNCTHYSLMSYTLFFYWLRKHFQTAEIILTKRNEMVKDLTEKKSNT